MNFNISTRFLDAGEKVVKSTETDRIHIILSSTYFMSNMHYCTIIQKIVSIYTIYCKIILNLIKS